MKTSNQHILETLIINKNYKSVSYDFSDVKELYIIQFFPAIISKNRIKLNIIDIDNITMKDDNHCIVNGNFRISKNAFFLKMSFKCDSTNGILYIVDPLSHQYCYLLIHQSLKDNFKDLVEYISKNTRKTYSIDDVFNILNIEHPEFEDKFKVEYNVDSGDDPIYNMQKLAKTLNIFNE